MIRFICTKDYDDMSRKAANIIGSLIVSKPNCVLGLATGSTPEGLYANLIKKYNAGDLDFSKIKTSKYDDYNVKP